MNNEQLVKAKELEQEINHLNELLIRITAKNKPVFYFSNEEHDKFRNVVTNDYSPFVNPVAMEALLQSVSGFIIKSIEIKILKLEKEFQDL